MRAFLSSLTWANRLLLGLFAVLAVLSLRQWLAYQPWDRQYMRTSFDDAYGFPMFVDQVDFWPGNTAVSYQPRNLDNQLIEPGLDSTTRSDTPTGTWGSGNAYIEGYPLPLPTEVAVSYTSVAEKRSYAGRVSLPRARFDSILMHMRAHPSLFDSLYSYPSSQPGFELQAGVGPGGRVVVWLKGRWSTYQVVVARGRVPAVPTTWPKPARPRYTVTDTSFLAHSFAELRRQVSRAELARMDSFPSTSPALIDSLARRYRYQLRLQGKLAPPAVISATFPDNEQEPLEVQDGEPVALHRAVPEAFQYTVTGAKLPTYQRSTLFNPRETQRAFTAIQRTCAPGEIPELLLVPKGEYVRVLLRNRHQTIVLRLAVTYVGPD